MATFLGSLNEVSDEERRRRLSGVLGDGEYIGAEAMFLRDSANAARVLSDNAAVAARVERERAAHVSKFAFMGDHAPAFDEGRATFLARQQHQPGAAARDPRKSVHRSFTNSACRFCVGFLAVRRTLGPDGSWFEAPMGRFIYRENIKHLRAQLALCADEQRGATIRGIIEAEQKRERDIDAGLE